MVKIASRERGTLGFADPGNYWTKTAENGRRRSSARASRSTLPLSVGDAHAGSSGSAQLEDGFPAASAGDKPAELCTTAVLSSIDSRQKDVLRVWLDARPPEMELFQEELEVLNEETDLPLEVIKAWHELATQGGTNSIPPLHLSPDTYPTVSGEKRAPHDASLVESTPDLTHLQEDEIFWTTSSVEPGTPIETNSAAAGDDCAGKQSTDQVHPWLDPHYFTRPGEDPLSAFSTKAVYFSS